MKTVEFLIFSKNTVEMIQSKKEIACELVASFQVQVGDVDQCLHLWRYTGGFEKVDVAYQGLYRDEVRFFFVGQIVMKNLLTFKFQDYLKLATERGNYLRARHLQYLLAFSYWPQITNREGGNIYEMR